MSLATGLWLAVLAHMVGDYVLQPDKMANEKTQPGGWSAALAHGAIHGGLFGAVMAPAWASGPHPWRIVGAVYIVWGTHAAIDHWRLARYVCYAKEWIGGRPSYRLADTRTGYDPAKPDWLAFWLMILMDNTMHVAISGACVWWVWAA